LNARIHGNQERDVNDEYIAMARRVLGSGDAEDSAKLKKMTDWKGGLTMQSVWIAYADKIKKDKREFGVWEMKKTVRMDMAE
jgi:hypothetical protein